MKKGFLPITILAAMVLVGCGKGGGKKDPTPTPSHTPTPTVPTPTPTPTPTPSVVDVYTANITNKEELSGDWHVGDPDMKVEVELTKNGAKVNVPAALADGSLKVISDHPEFVSVIGQKIHAVEAGQAKITIEYKGEEDSVDVTAIAKQTNKDKYGTNHEGTEEDPFDNEDAVKVGLWCKDNGDTTEELYVKGVVQRFYNAPGSGKAVAYYLAPAQENGQQFEVYNCKKVVENERVDLTDDDIWVGAEVLAKGLFTYYVAGNQPETSSATFIEVTGGAPKPQPRQVIPCTLAQALEAGAALADGADSYDYYQFDAFVTVKNGDNYFLTATQGEALVTATSDEAHGSKSYYSNAFELYSVKDAEVAALLMKNAKVTVTAVLKNYHGQVENNLTMKKEDITVIQEGQPWVIPEHDVTVAQALEVINGLEDGKTTVDLYNLKDVYVIAITGEYSSQYGNMSFTVADTADGTDTLTVFRAKTDAETAAKVVVGAQVTIKGNLQRYVKNDVMTPELTGVESITVGGGELPPVINYGTQDNPLTVEEAKVVIDTVEAGSLTAEELWVEGVVSELLADSYGHKVFWMQSSDGQTARFFEGYQLDFAEGVDQTALAVGATVLLHGFAKNYKGTYEITSYKDADNKYVYPLIVAITPGEGGDPEKVPEPAVQEVTLKQFIDSEAADKTVKFHFSAEIKAFKSGSTKDKYGNMTLTDGENDLVVYGSTANAEKLVWNDKDAYAFTNPQDFMTNEKTKDLNVGDTVEVHFIRYVYNSVIQGQGIILSSTPGEGGQEPPVEEEGYKLDGSITGGSNGYAVASDITQEGINWSVTGNTTVSPWRVGGKNLDGVDRNIYSKTAIANNVNKIKISFGSSNITVNSINVGVYSTAEKAAAGGEGDVANFTPTFAASSIITVEKANETSWANCFYNIAINVTESSSSNKYVEFVSALFIYA